MTDKTFAPEESLAPAADQKPADFHYGHGRMPLFMKLLWIAFLVFITYYVVTYLLTAVGVELQGS
jgi:hypothetical protein